jgi:hypothetical protein
MFLIRKNAKMLSTSAAPHHKSKIIINLLKGDPIVAKVGEIKAVSREGEGEGREKGGRREGEGRREGKERVKGGEGRRASSQQNAFNLGSSSPQE